MEYLEKAQMITRYYCTFQISKLPYRAELKQQLHKHQILKSNALLLLLKVLGDKLWDISVCFSEKIQKVIPGSRIFKLTGGKSL